MLRFAQHDTPFFHSIGASPLQPAPSGRDRMGRGAIVVCPYQSEPSLSTDWGAPASL
jgi:hypothetical protein